MRGGEPYFGGSALPCCRRASVLAAVLVLVSCPPVLADTAPGKLVVVLYPSESDGAPGVVQADRAIRATFTSESTDRIEIRNEYVDTARTRDPVFKRAQAAFLRSKYAGRRVDLLMTGLSTGLDFTLDCRDELFPGVPVVFLAVDERELTSRRLPDGVTGVPVRMDLAGTLDLALRLQPNTSRVFVVAGGTPFDRHWEGEARRSFRPYEPRVEITYLTGLPMDELLDRVGNLPGQSVIYYLHIFQDGVGRPLVPADALKRLAARANAPVYSHVNTYVGLGTVGGRVFSFEGEGRRAARLALKLLAGDGAPSIPPLGPVENGDVFDWREIRRWGIPEDRLPPGSVLLFKDATFWEKYRWQVAGMLTLCAVEALLIAGLLLQRKRRRRADDRLLQVIETAPTGTLLVNRAGVIVTANGRVEELFGYRRDELLGQPVELLVPVPSQTRHRKDREEYCTTPEFRRMGSGRPLFGRRKDGSEFPVEVGLSPLPTERDLLVLVSVVDLTERLRMEDLLRTNQRELKRLTGRLIEAQEIERRRIARELHDDINQSLALLAIELDVSARHPPASAGAMGEHLRGLSDRVKDLSTAVHDLSRRLHPARLEHQGLVAAVRGLCQELAHHHGLRVDLTDAGTPEPVPEAIALCLYRVVQEALRNVIRHSGTDAARVDLTGSPDGLRLRISDSGVGFDAGSSRESDGLGLVSMRERLHLIGGILYVRTRPGEGTLIDVRVPAAAVGRPGSGARTDAGG